MEKGATRHEQTTSPLEFDEYDSNRKAKELSSLMREKPCQTFLTVTSNGNGTPGLASLCLAFKIASNLFLNPEELTKESTYEHFNYWDDIDHDKEIYKNHYMMHLMLVDRIHDRTMICLRLLLKGNLCAEFPKVDGHFDRKKLQIQDT